MAVMIFDGGGFCGEVFSRRERLPPTLVKTVQHDTWSISERRKSKSAGFNPNRFHGRAGSPKQSVSSPTISGRIGERRLAERRGRAGAVGRGTHHDYLVSNWFGGSELSFW